jgi:glycosyltransferase involved in cell wall biosynthesis
MPVLFIVIEQPSPPRSGADLRNWQNIAATAEVAETGVVFLTGLNAVPPAPPLRLALWRRLDPRPPHVIWHPEKAATPIDVDLSAAAVAEIDRILPAFKPRVVVLGHTQLHALAPRVRRAGAALVVDMHNVESHLWRQLVSPRVPFRYLERRFGPGARAIEAVERELLGQAAQIWLCSEEDRRRLANLGTGPAELRVIPNGLPAGRPHVARPREAAATDRRARLLFLGHLAYPPNVQAAYFLCREVAPLLQRLPENPELVLAGRAPTRKLRALAERAGATLVADPPDVAPLLETADVMLAPLGGGGGTRLKVLEAWGAGLPVVATATAVEGLGAVDGRSYLEAHGPAAFVAAATRLLREPALYRRLSAAGLAAVDDRFSPARVSEAVRAALAQASLAAAQR